MDNLPVFRSAKCVKLLYAENKDFLFGKKVLVEIYGLKMLDVKFSQG